MNPKDKISAIRQKFSTYKYDELQHIDSFISKSPKVEDIELKPFPTKIFTFWTGNNAMSEKRATHFNTLQQKANVEVKLITPDNLKEYILNDYPLHTAFENLSLVHKSDYLRCYFMHFYGGGYSDIKATKQSWESAFNQLRHSNKWALGYKELKTKWIAKVGGKTEEIMRKEFRTLIGNCAYICRPQTPFTTEWYNELHKRMDKYADELEKHPGNVMGDNKGYPIPWTKILGDIFHPLCLKYHDKFTYSTTIIPTIKSHR